MEDKMQYTKGVLVGIVTRDNNAEEVDKSLDELARLLDTAGGETVGKLVQNREAPDAATAIGMGKVAELASICKMNDVEVVVFDTDLSPSQIRNLEDGIGNDVRVIDRSMLILDIFALHAVTGEGKLQVELAQLKYTAPRLTGHGKDMSRLGGGIGTRGPGESKLESDKRHIKRRITALEAEIEVLDKNRRTMRISRDRSGMKKIAIVGYTNAGKSTLLNQLTGAGILAEDKLFATLDPTTRKFKLPCGESILLTDTVGFIRKLPHHLVSAFKSTLDEVVYADIIMMVIDASDAEAKEHIEVTENLLAELGAGDKPILYVCNKCDKGIVDYPVPANGDKNVAYISAFSGQGCDMLVSKLEAVVLDGKKLVIFDVPNAEAGALNTLYKLATVENIEYGAEFVTVEATVDAKVRGMLKKYERISGDGDNG